MNRERRKELEKAISLLNDAQENLDAAMEIVDSVKDEEQEAYDNLPESIQYGEKGDIMQENVDELDDASSELDSIRDSVEEQIDAIQNVIDKK